jgi:hypothetical protein
MWFEDLSAYENRPPDRDLEVLDSGATPVTLNVGWLERGRAFATGDVAGAVVERLRLLGEHAPTQVMRGGTIAICVRRTWTTTIWRVAARRSAWSGRMEPGTRRPR